VLSQCCHVCQRSVRWDRYLYVRTWHDGYHMFPREMVFDLVDDPHEQRNLARERPDLCREGAWRYQQWHDEQMLAMSEESDVDPMYTVLKEGGPFHARGALKPYFERLRETGRDWAIPELERRHPREIA